MKKKLNLVIKKLDKYPLSSLSAEEMGLYFEHRLQSITFKKKVLVKDELEYLLSETGPGNRRIDPELLSHLLDTPIPSNYAGMPEIQTILKQKQVLEKYIIENKNAQAIQTILLKALKNYLKEASVVSSTPFIIDGTFDDIPVTCLIKNGDWILPNKELFAFLAKCQKDKRFPIIIAKKISGILFPVFKGLSVLGLNLYKIYIPKKAKELADNVISKEDFFADIHYNNQFQFIDDSFTKDILTEHWDGEPLKNFFEKIARDHLKSYYAVFLEAKINIKENFLDTVSQFRKNKSSKGLIENYKNRIALIEELDRTHSK